MWAENIEDYRIAYENSDLDREINYFLKDWKLDENDNRKLLEILTINIKRNLEKRILINTEKSNLLRVLYSRGITEQVKKKLSEVLFPDFKYDENKSNKVNNIRYWYTVLREEWRILWKEKIKYIQKAIWFSWEKEIDGLFWKESFVKYREKNYFWNKESLSDFYDNYKNIYTQIEKLDNWEIKKIQKNIWAEVDWFFGMETYSLIRKYYENNEVNNISNILDNNSEDSSYWFKTIENVEEMKKFLKSDNITIEDIKKWILEWRKSVRVWTNFWTKADYVDPKELGRLYNDIRQAKKYTSKSYEKWLKNYSWGVDYKSLSEYWNKEFNKLEKGSLFNLLASADKYMWARERWRGLISRDLRKKILKFWLDMNKPKDYWCAAFIWQVLIDSWYAKNVKDVRRKVWNTNRAANYLWGKDFPWHIGIKKWNMMINWNSRNSVKLSSLWPKTMTKFVWWILPEHVWDKSKVHKNKKKIPDWAIMVFYRWDKNPKWS